jgi:hypothetical protein
MGTERHKIRVKDTEVVSGIARSGVRLRLMPGIYVAHWLSTNRPGSMETEAALRFLGAVLNNSGEDLDVFKADRPELCLWPDLPPSAPFEILG